MKILITGARGMLGKEVSAVFAAKHTVIATDIPELDITNPIHINNWVLKHKPDIILHLAAMTDVDGCEKNPEAAFKINISGTKNIADACRENKIQLLYISTSDIFDGTKKTPYIETDIANPINKYGKSKYEGELYIRQILPNSYIIRTCWLFGGGRDDKKFVARIIAQAKSRKSLDVVNNIYGSPTYTKDLAHAIFRITGNNRPGIYHTANAGCCSRYEIAEKIIEYSGISTCKINGVSGDKFPTIAPRPRMAAIESVNLSKVGLDNLIRPWQEALREYIKRELEM